MTFRLQMTSPVRGIAMLGLAVVLAACVGAEPVDVRNTLLQPGYQIDKPAGEGPFPVALLFHGCVGLVGGKGEKEIMRDYADIAVRNGYMAIIVDSFRPREISFDMARSRVCTGLHLRGPTRAGDVVAALDFARELPNASDEGFVLAGWSHGGWTVMEVMTMDMVDDWPAGLAKPDPDVMQPVDGVYLTYPYCGFGARTRARDYVWRVPTEVVIAGNDSIARPGPCARAFARMVESGVPLTTEVFEGTTHAFDENDQAEDSTSVFDPEATARAHRRFAAFLQKVAARHGAPAATSP